jgi:hypothetical protein
MVSICIFFDMSKFAAMKIPDFDLTVPHVSENAQQVKLHTLVP